MNILVIGGMHGNEPLGLTIVKLFQEKPVKNIDTMFGNEQAIAANSRFIGRDLNRSFPGDAQSKEYEARRAGQLLQLAKNYDVVLDFHNTYCPNNDCGFVGDTASQSLYGVAWLLGLERIIVADYDCLNKYAPNCLSVEVSMSSSLNQAVLWYERIQMLAKLDRIVVSEARIEKYRFAYRMTLEDKERLDLPNKNLRAFEPMDSALAKTLGIKSPAFPIFINDDFTPYNYGGVLNKI